MDVNSPKLSRVARTALRTYFEPIRWTWRSGVRCIWAVKRRLSREGDIDELSAAQLAAIRAEAAQHLPKGRLLSEQCLFALASKHERDVD